MAEAIRMPLLSDTMKEGVIAAWHKKVGDTVKSDDVIAEVETDKATMEVMPYVDGTLLYIGAEPGKAVPVNGIMAIVGKPGEDFQSILNSEGQNAPAQDAPQEQQPASSDTPQQQAPAQQQAQAQPAQAEDKPAAPQTAAPAPKTGNATVVRMPLLSDTMTEGKIVAWHKKVGDTVKSDDVIADVETDKATMEVMPYADGTLLYIGVEEGKAAKVNDIIAIVGKPGTDVQPYLQSGGDGGATAPAAGTSQEHAQPAAQQQQTQSPQPAAQQTSEDERLKASPLARKLAEEKGIDLHQVKGSGDNGRIIKRDVDSFVPQAATAARASQPATTAGGQTAQQAAIPQAVPGQESHTDLPLSQMRKTIARRLSESFINPHFYLRMTVTMDNAMEARKAINEVSPAKVSFNDLIIKACAMALRKHPEVNSSWMGEHIRENHHIHIGTAVAVDEGLIVPVIRFADQKSLSQIAAEASTLIDKARNKKLQPLDYTGNTFSVSNLGMMDMDEFTAIINPPDSCILAIGKIQATPVAENGQIVVRQLLKLTLTCDHRVVDGAVGARFMQTLKAHLENPVTMLV